MPSRFEQEGSRAHRGDPILRKRCRLQESARPLDLRESGGNGVSDGKSRSTVRIPVHRRASRSTNTDTLAKARSLVKRPSCADRKSVVEDRPGTVPDSALAAAVVRALVCGRMQQKAPAREFPPLERVRRDLRVKWYRCPIEPARLRELMQRSDLQGAFQTLGHLGLWAACGAATAWFFIHAMWLPFAIALWCQGTVGTFMRGLGTHELGHGTVFKTKWLKPLLPGADVAAHLVELPRVRDEPHLPPSLHALSGGRPRGGAADRPASEAAADTAAAHRQRAGDVSDHRGHRAHGHSPLPPGPDRHPAPASGPRRCSRWPPRWSARRCASPA